MTNAAPQVGPMEQCNPPWHSVECYTGQLPGFCGENADPPWQPILEVIKEFSLAHTRNDMVAVDERWIAINHKLGELERAQAAAEEMCAVECRARRALERQRDALLVGQIATTELLMEISKKTWLIKASGMGGVLAEIYDMIETYALDAAKEGKP